MVEQYIFLPDFKKLNQQQGGVFDVNKSVFHGNRIDVPGLFFLFLMIGHICFKTIIFSCTLKKINGSKLIGL